MKAILVAAALAVAAITPTWAGQCADPALEEERITEQLAVEPDRPRLIVTGEDLERFRQNMKYAFDIDVQADTVYFIAAKTKASRPAVHVFTVLKGCITYYVVTDMALMSEMLHRDPATWPDSPKPAPPPVVLPPVDIQRAGLVAAESFVLILDAPAHGLRMFYVHDTYKECVDDGWDKWRLLRAVLAEQGDVISTVRWRCEPLNEDGSFPVSPASEREVSL